MEGRPLVVLGVNSDPVREKAQMVMARQKLSKRSWWDGVQGPITRQWHVTTWPTVFLIDAHGTIRFKNVRGGELDRAVEALVEEAEREQLAAARREAAMSRR
jgi:hypothetical protein